MTCQKTLVSKEELAFLEVKEMEEEEEEEERSAAKLAPILPPIVLEQPNFFLAQN